MQINIKKYLENTNLMEFSRKHNINYRTLQEIYYKHTLNPRIDILYKIAKALNIKVDDLIEE